MPNSAEIPDIPGVSGLEWIGGGGFGAVYRGFQAEYDRPVAVKVLRLDPADRKAAGRFDRERKLMGRLSSAHHHVVTVLGSGLLPGGRAYLITEYCAGGSLAGRPPMPAATVLQLGVKVAGVLRAAHADGIVHRDVKPANILLRADGEPALADFGLSIRPSYDLSHGLDALAPEYAAPESLRDGVYDNATDVYALGATLYALLAGTPPFPHRPGEAPMAFMTRVVRDPPPPPAGVPPRLWQLLAEMLAKEPLARPGAAQVAERLAELRAGDPVPVGEVTRPRTAPPPMDPGVTRVRTPRAAEEPAPLPARRRVPRWPFVVGGVVLLTGGVAAALAAGSADPPPPKAASSAAPPRLVLAEPVDRTTSVDLTWQSDAGNLSYAVIVGEQGRTPRVQIVRGAARLSVPVSPDSPYCFQVQGTDGGTVLDSNVRSIRGAVCTFG